MNDPPTHYAIAMQDPLRSPAWRYERATEMSQSPGTRFSSKHDDEMTRDLVKFLFYRKHVYATVQNTRQRDGLLFQKFPDYWSAFRIFDLADNEPMRAIMEARLVSGQEYSEIATLMAVPPTAVELYHDLFYMVRDRLTSLDYIASHVIGPVFQAGIEEYNWELMLKYFGYFGGPKLLQAVVYGFQNPMMITNDNDMLTFLDGKVSDNIRIQTLLATTVMRPSKFDIRSLIEGYSALLALEQKIQGVNEEGAWMTELIKTLQRSVPIPRGKDTLEFVQNRSTSYSMGEVELRASEQRLLANGQALPNADALTTFHRPEPESAVGVTEPTKEHR